MKFVTDIVKFTVLGDSADAGMDNKDPTAALLEDVFNEVDSLENAEQVPKTSGFLEDIVKLDAELILNKKKAVENNASEPNVEKTIEDIDSLIHEGLTDSSDDEENKYFEEAKYNQCGKDIKKIIKENQVTQSSYISERADVKSKDFSVNARLARDKLQKHLEALNNGSGSLEVQKASSCEKGNLLVDPILNMRIINPLVSSTVLREKMIGRVSIGTLKIKNFLQSSSWKTTDWVTGGVIISKVSRTSQKGNQYCIWNISDLTGDIKIISVFLFGSAYKDFWKTSVGTIVGILNPAVMDGNDKTEATLRVENAYKILIMGTSKDYGICRSKKKNGEKCSSIVNTAKSEFCIYHVQKEYVKACRRSDLQPPKIGSINAFKQKLLGKTQPQPLGGGKIFTGIRGKKSSKNAEKDRQRLQSLSQVPLTPKAPQVTVPTNSCLNPIKEKTKFQAITPPVKLDTRMVNLDIPITKIDRNNARQRALEYVRKHGPLRKTEEDSRGKRTKTPEQIASLKRKLEVEDTKNKKQKGSDGTVREIVEDPKRQKLERVGMTDKFFQLMNSGVKDQELLKTAEIDQREKYFDKLETREKMEDKMASTFKVECNAVRCLKCNYKAFSASELCKKEKHPLKVFKAVKRFWKCANCSNRTVSIELLPIHACKTCGGSSWERTSMMAEKGPNLTIEPLSLRGMEEKFVGSAIKNPNLNLLVPEEAT